MCLCTSEDISNLVLLNFSSSRRLRRVNYIVLYKGYVSVITPFNKSRLLNYNNVVQFDVTNELSKAEVHRMCIIPGNRESR